jgi:hypothetical protein
MANPDSGAHTYSAKAPLHYRTPRQSNWEERFTIPASDIELAAKRDVTVVMTAAALSAENFEKPNPLTALNENAPFCCSFWIDNRDTREENPARAEWTEVRSYACMRLETFGERVCFT